MTFTCEHLGEDVTLYLGDCLEVLPALAAGSVDAVVTDPPYGIGIAAWDNNIDMAAVLGAASLLLRTTGYVAFFGQFPTLADWHLVAQRFYKWCEHIVWVKRTCTPNYRLMRSHESIMIYRAIQGGRSKFYSTYGPYEDVKLPGVLLDTVSIEAIDRYIKDLWVKATRGKTTSISPGKHNTTWRRYDLCRGKRCRSPRSVNFTNVWSFLPPGNAIRNGAYEHDTEKPIEMMKRLVEMLSPQYATVLDPFMGSGTTGVACVQTGRKFIGVEIEPKYYEIAKRRISEAQMQGRLPL